MEKYPCPPRFQKGVVDPQLRSWVQEQNLGLGWDALTHEMQKTAQIMVTLRSGKEVQQSDDDEEVEHPPHWQS